jgi:hypothetical protein
MKQFEIWQSQGASIATCVCPAGPSGDGRRSTNEPGPELKHVLQAYSEVDQAEALRAAE